MSHSNSVQNPTEINLDAAILASPIGEEHDIPSQSSRLIPEYVNLHVSGLRRSKIIQGKFKRGNVIPKVLGLIALFVSVVMHDTNSTLPETESFAYKLLHHEERSKSSPYNFPNFTNPLASIIEAGNDNFTFNEATSQPDRLDFVEATRKEIGAHENYRHWTLVRRRELYGKKTTISIWYFKRKRAPDGILVKHKSRLCSHGGMRQWGLNNRETYSPVVNCMSIRAMLTLTIIRELHTKSVDFVLAYTQADVKSEIFMELPIGFGVEGSHPKEWVPD